MARSSIWDGSAWVSMTGGAGEEAGGPDDTYLRLDQANNPSSPNNFLTTSLADALYFPLDGSDFFGDLRIITDTPSIAMLSNSELNGYSILANVNDVSDLGLSFRDVDNVELFVLAGNIGLATMRMQFELVATQGLPDRRIRNITVSSTVPAGQQGDIWFDTS